MGLNDAPGSSRINDGEKAPVIARADSVYTKAAERQEENKATLQQYRLNYEKDALAMNPADIERELDRIAKNEESSPAGNEFRATAKQILRVERDRRVRQRAVSQLELLALANEQSSEYIGDSTYAKYLVKAQKGELTQEDTDTLERYKTFRKDAA